MGPKDPLCRHGKKDEVGQGPEKKQGQHQLRQPRSLAPGEQRQKDA